LPAGKVVVDCTAEAVDILALHKSAVEQAGIGPQTGSLPEEAQNADHLAAPVVLAEAGRESLEAEAGPDRRPVVWSTTPAAAADESCESPVGRPTDDRMAMDT